MMKSPFLILHKSQYDRLKSSTTYKVFDNLPEREEFPYVVIGETTARDWSDKFVPGQEVFSTIHIWSQYPGRKEALEIQDACLQALTSSPLNLGQNFYAVFSSLDMAEVIIDIDGVTRHAILRFRYLIEEVLQ